MARGRLLVLAALALLVGCGAVDKRKAIKNCDFTIRSVRVEDVRIRSTTVGVELDVYNPNRDEVIVDELDYCVWSEDRCFVQGHVTQPLTIPPRATRPMSVKADVAYLSTAVALKRLATLQRTRYWLTGTVYLNTFVGRIAFDFKSRVRIFP